MKKKNRGARKWAKLAERALRQIAMLDGKDPQAFIRLKAKAAKYVTKAKEALQA